MKKENIAAYWRNKRQGVLPQPWEFIAVDGEGIEAEGGQNYALLSSSLHNPILNRHGLHTEECLRWLLDLKTGERQQIVSFAFTYDANKILHELPYRSLVELYETESCWFEGKEGDYRIAWTKGKTLRITEYTARTAYHHDTKRVRTVLIWDVFGFFQGSFVKAVEDYRLELTAEEWSILKEGKGARGGFDWKDREEIIRYNHLECDLLVKLMNNLQNLLRGMDLHLTRWDGAGSIAAALMLKNKVKEHVFQGYSTEVEDALMRAYFGGRSQCVQFGVFDGPIYHYDINSAYPSSYLDLPSLHGEWTRTKSYQPDEKYALYRVSWNIPSKEPLTPFPYRDKTGSIRYPHKGSGIYHSVLVKEAMTYFKRWIRFEEGFVFKPATHHKPFGWVLPFMNERLRLKREGDLRHITMKLGGNSIYGKTAQGITYGDGLPPYQSYFWAGRITAWAQAQLLKAGIQDPSRIVFFGTDAVFSQSPLQVPLGSELGTWEDCNDSGPMTRFELFQPGLYRMHFEGEEPTVRTRGFHREEVNFDDILKVWEVHKFGGVYDAKVTRFRGLQVTMALKRWEEWGEWVELKKAIHLQPGGWGITEFPEKEAYHTPIPKDRNIFRFKYIEGDVLSAPFERKDLRLPSGDTRIELASYADEQEDADQEPDDE